jgi:hypothetical protein
MDKIKFGLFDIFVYTVPGLLLMFVLFLFQVNLTSGVDKVTENLVTTVDKVSVNMTLLILFISYLLGFVLHFFGYSYFHKIGKGLYKKDIKGMEQGLSIMEKKFVLVRHHSKENFVYVEQWLAFRGMSFNLSLAFLIIGLVIMLKLIISLTFSIDWVIVIIGLLILSTVTLRRAVTFHIWSHNTLNEAVETLGLTEKKTII